jgi:hypothetical protein
MVGLCFLYVPSLFAQDTTAPQDQSSPSAPAPSADPDPLPVMLPHPESDRLWLSGQANFISQWHPAFHSPYSGKNSLPPEAQDATSRVLTLFTGLRLTGTAELLCDVQESGGHGIGEALGLGGITNLDVVRNTTLSKKPYVARLMWHQIIHFSANFRSAGSSSALENSAWSISSISIRTGAIPIFNS